MAKTHRMVCTIHTIERTGQSKNGNPKYMLYTDYGNYRTQVDGAVSYEVPNWDRFLPARAMLTLTAANRVVDMSVA